MSDTTACSECGREIFLFNRLWYNASDRELHTCGETTLFVKGQRVCAKAPYQAQWRVGIITDVFLAPVTQQYVYVVNGEGYYASEVTEFVTDAEPQSLRVTP